MLASNEQSRNRPAEDRSLDLIESAPGTLMGTLLRKFWQPVAMASDVLPGKAIGLRILNEDLTLYRGQSGLPHLVASRCAHRGTELRAGWVEDDCIRCVYHGWKYDGTGQCVEMPAEDASFARKMKIPGYPTREYAGLVFAFLGSGEPPIFPRRAELERGLGVQWVVKQVWPCNWLQRVENSMDALHVSFVHHEGPFGEAVTPVVPRLQYEETEFGLVQRADRGNGNVRVSDFQFPNCNHTVVPRPDEPWDATWTDIFGYKLPVDDTHCVEFTINDAPVTGQAEQNLRRWIAERGQYDPSEHEQEIFAGIMPTDRTHLIAAQDYIAQVLQGPIADRSMEHLGKSDAGIILLRKVMRRELDAIRNGLPGKQWRPRFEPAQLPVPPTVLQRAAGAAS